MFALKLFRSRNGQLVTRVVAVDHLQTMTIGKSGRMIEIWAFQASEPSAYDVYYIGEADPDMNAPNDTNHWGWALLENWEGNTSEHFRPAGYGHLSSPPDERAPDKDAAPRGSSAERIVKHKASVAAAATSAERIVLAKVAQHA